MSCTPFDPSKHNSLTLCHSSNLGEQIDISEGQNLEVEDSKSFFAGFANFCVAQQFVNRSCDTSLLFYFPFETMPIEAVGQCIPPQRHVCRGCLSWASDVMTSQLLWRCLLVHALHCSVAQRSRLTQLSVSPGSDESGKQSLFPDGDPDRRQNLIICSSAHCQPS